MRRLRIRPIWIYILGIAPLAFFYDRLKELIESKLMFVILVICYLLLVRFFAEMFGEPRKGPGSN